MKHNCNVQVVVSKLCEAPPGGPLLKMLFRLCLMLYCFSGSHAAGLPVPRHLRHPEHPRPAWVGRMDPAARLTAWTL